MTYLEELTLRLAESGAKEPAQEAMRIGAQLCAVMGCNCGYPSGRTEIQNGEEIWVNEPWCVRCGRKYALVRK